MTEITPAPPELIATMKAPILTILLALASGSIAATGMVTSIGDGAFITCTMLTSVTIPAGVTSIGALAFMYCDHLTSASFLGDAPMSSSGVFYYTASGFKMYYFNAKSVIRITDLAGVPGGQHGRLDANCQLVADERITLQCGPLGMINRHARETGVEAKARSFSVLSHLSAMLFAQLSHAIGLNDVCDWLRLKAAVLARLCVLCGVRIAGILARHRTGALANSRQTTNWCHRT